LKLNIAEQDWGRRALAQKNGRLEYVFSGAPRVAHFATYEKRGWLVLAILPKSEIAQKASGIRDAAALLGLGAIALVVAVVWLLTGNLIRSVRGIALSLSSGAEQTASAAWQVASASQTLAEGASEQAASLEETSSSLEERSSVTKRNTQNAVKVNELARQARAAADTGATDMQAMAAAMNEIKSSGDDTAKIIETIDEIAFQTNILALNAAVEAARAGEAGMGFAVVADEVRNLAQRAAQAAKETAFKIENAVTKTGQGIEQLNDAVGQMDSATQSNAASAEESASAAEELNAQAESLEDSVASLLELVNGQTALPTRTARAGVGKPDQAGKERTLKTPVRVPGDGAGKSPRQTRQESAPLATAARPGQRIPPERDFRDSSSNPACRGRPEKAAPPLVIQDAFGATKS
jgi:hypothetical protein